MQQHPGRTKIFLILFLTWAVLYLPALGEAQWTTVKVRP
jgi:hypothetical protein